MDAVTVTAQTCSTLSIRPVTVQLPGCLPTTMAICSPIRRTSATTGSLLTQVTSRSKVSRGAIVALSVRRPWTGTVSACWSMVTVATATWGRQWIASFSSMVEIGEPSSSFAALTLSR